jgi:2-amino-4-hydroxy-6-hydroxymethyldihydropteridine diphosphokinase
MKENKVFIGLGSNLGDRNEYLNEALENINDFARVIAKSSIYETEPVGYKNQGMFLNMVVEAMTFLGPEELLARLKKLEKEMGRPDRGMRFGPREIDLDILLYEDEVVNKDGIEIPHPRMAERGFVLEPLSEIAPQIIHPILNKTILELWTQLKSKN